MPTQDDSSNREEGKVLLERTGTIATITLSRPGALNALTWPMYQQLKAYLDRLTNNETVRVVILRGAGKAFATGTDIAQFQDFTIQEGIDYERKMESLFEQLYTFPRPVIAAIHGYAIGAGNLLAAACDLRYATPSAQFGVPIARTLGNGLSLKNYRYLQNAFGPMRTKEMLFTARLLSAHEALECGFLTAVFEENRIFAQVADIAQRISTLAPLSIWAAKEAHLRIVAAQSDDIPFDDVLERTYASQDFAEGVEAYIAKRKPQWRGR
jgi:enoyl-CoA hydratase/carnithine racemase